MIETNTVVTEVTLSQLTEKQPNTHDIENFQSLVGSSNSDSLGQGVIDYISDLKTEIDQARQDVNQAVSAKDTLDPSDLIQVQWAMMRLTLQEELIAKTVGRSNQNIETLLKTQ